MQPSDCLRRYPLFNLLTVSQQEIWLAAGQEMTVAAGETLFQEGAAGVWAYLVRSGRVRMLRRSSSGREITLGLIGVGELFGEYALLPPHRNTATCRAAETARLLALPLLALRPLPTTLPGVSSNLKNWLRLHALLAYLRGLSFLGFMSAPSALRFLDRLHPVSFPAGHTIQADGLSDDCWFFLERGQVHLQSVDAPHPQQTRELGPGDSFGERALLSRDKLPVAAAVTEAQCLRLSRADFVLPQDGTADRSLQSLNPRPLTLCQKYVWIGQQEAADCGVASLAMIARFHGLTVSVEVLRQQIEVSRAGASLQELQRAAAGLGLRSLAVRVGPEQLAQIALPALVHFQGGHYGVLYAWGVEGAVVGDPATGILRMSQEMFGRNCSGNLLLIRPLSR